MKLLIEMQTMIKSLIENQFRHNGRLLSQSKTFYRLTNPNADAYFNANIFAGAVGKVWYGDIDFNIDAEELQRLANLIGLPLYILREHDGRFGAELAEESEIISKAVRIFTPQEKTA